MRWFVVVAAVVLGGCATDRHAAAVQRTAVGGGLVAVGSLGLVGAAVGGGALLTSEGATQRQLVTSLGVPLAIGAAVEIIVLGTGVAMIKFAEEDLVPSSQASATSSSSSRLRVRDDDDDFRRPRSANKRTSGPAPPSFAAVSERFDVARVPRGIIVRPTISTWDLENCRRALLVVDGVETSMPLDDGGGYLLTRRDLNLGSSATASINLCAVTIDLTDDERRALASTLAED